MVFTQFSVLNRDSPGVDENRRSFVRQGTKRIELHLCRDNNNNNNFIFTFPFKIVLIHI